MPRASLLLIFIICKVRAINVQHVASLWSLELTQVKSLPGNGESANVIRYLTVLGGKRGVGMNEDGSIQRTTGGVCDGQPTFESLMDRLRVLVQPQTP